MEAQSCLYSWKIHAWCWGDSRQELLSGWKEECFGVQCSERRLRSVDGAAGGPTRLQEEGYQP